MRASRPAVRSFTALCLTTFSLLLLAACLPVHAASSQPRSPQTGVSQPVSSEAVSSQAATPLAASTPAAAARPGDIVLPPVNGRFDYQIGGSYPPSPAVTIVDRDRLAPPVPGKYNICYVNAFQTQPEEAHFWTGSHGNLLLKTTNGKYLTDPDWPGEYLLDTSTAAKRESIAAIEKRWIDGCRTAGFQGLEPDNLDSWTRSKKLLTRADNVALATLLASRAHEDGLAIAQKNTAELGKSGKTSVGFDFAIAEECQVYSECASYTAPYGERVIEIEYTDNARSAYTKACASRGRKISVILRDRDVVPAGDSGYHYEFC
jgi:hypothetical protein